MPDNKRSVTPDDAEMGKRLRLRRVERRMSQTELGNALGVSFQQVQKYEKGVNRIGAARLQQIAALLDVPITFFYGNGEGGVANERQSEINSLLFYDSHFALRLLRAYHAIDDAVVQRRVLSLMESMASP